MNHTISILVENHAGILSRISGLFSRRGFNIHSLAVGITADPAVSRITIVVDGNDYIVEQVEKQLNKLIEVIKLRRIPPDDMISRELILLKLSSLPDDIPCGYRLCDTDSGRCIVELCDTTAAVEAALASIPPHTVLETVRTGTVALQQSEMLEQ